MFQYIPSGDSAFIIKAGNEVSADLNKIVRKLLIRIELENIDGVIDFIPAYNELLICYDPCRIGYRKLLDLLHKLETDMESIGLPESFIIHLPVLYGGDCGPDLYEVAATNHMSEDEVVNIHCSVNYLVYMLGFTPGFCYLGGMDRRIATPRKKNPRLKIPAGAVGIADMQTGIYPIESPGGWQLIGQTPVKLFDQENDPAFLVNQGDYIRFYSVNENEFIRISREVEKGIFVVKRNKYRE